MWLMSVYEGRKQMMRHSFAATLFLIVLGLYGSASEIAIQPTSYMAVERTGDFDLSDYLVVFDSPSLPDWLRAKALATLLNQEHEWATPGNHVGVFGLPVRVRFVPVFVPNSGDDPVAYLRSRIWLDYSLTTNTSIHIGYDLGGAPREMLVFSGSPDSPSATSYQVKQSDPDLRKRKELRMTGRFRLNAPSATNLLNTIEVARKEWVSAGDWIALCFYGEHREGFKIRADKLYPADAHVAVNPVLVDGITDDLALVVFKMTEPSSTYIATWWCMRDQHWVQIADEEINALLVAGR